MTDGLILLVLFGVIGVYLEWVRRDLQRDYNREDIRKEANRDRSKDWERHRG